MPSDLKSCPFCGVKPHDAHQHGSVWFVGADHTKHCFFSDLPNTEAEAIAAWNQRAPAQPSGDMVEAVAHTLSEAGGAASWEHALTCSQAAIAAMQPHLTKAYEAGQIDMRERAVTALELRQGLFGGEPMTTNEASIARHMLEAIRALPTGGQHG